MCISEIEVKSLLVYKTIYRNKKSPLKQYGSIVSTGKKILLAEDLFFEL